MRWLIVLALIGCRKEPRNAAPPAVENRVDAGATRPAPPDAASDACVSACVKSNQMRATSIEQIEADCRAQCATAPAPP